MNHSEPSPKVKDAMEQARREWTRWKIRNGGIGGTGVMDASEIAFAAGFFSAAPVYAERVKAMEAVIDQVRHGDYLDAFNAVARLDALDNRPNVLGSNVGVL